MKFKIEVELNEIDEDYTIDETVIKEIVNKVVQKVSTNIQPEVIKKAANKFNFAIDSFIDDTLTNFLDRKIRITDNYGSVKDEYENVEEMLKEKFDNFMTQRVNSNGEPVSSKKCSHGRFDTKIEHMLNSEFKKYKYEFKDICCTMAKKMKSEVLDTVKNTYADEATEVFLNEILPKIKLKE